MSHAEKVSGNLIRKPESLAGAHVLARALLCRDASRWMCASLTCSDLTECSARVLAKIPDARLRRERRLARSMERRPTHSIRTPDGSELQSAL